MLVESNLNDRVSCISISMDGTVLGIAFRDCFKVYIIDKVKKRMNCVHTAIVLHHIAMISMTPMSKFIAVL